MILERHPDVARLLVGQLEEPTTPCFQAVARVARDLTGVHGFEPPSWRELAMGARPEPWEPEDFEPGCTRDGWQHEASARVEETFRVESLFPRMDDSGKALLRSQGGTRGRAGVVHLSSQQVDVFHSAIVPGHPAPSVAPSSSDRA